MLGFTQLIVAVSVAFVYIYFLMDRICKCIEYCALAKAYSRFREVGSMTKLEDVKQKIDKQQI